MSQRDDKVVQALKEFLAECGKNAFEDHRMSQIMATFAFGSRGLVQEGAMIKKAIQSGAMAYVDRDYSTNRGKVQALLSESEELTSEERHCILRWLDLAVGYEESMPGESNDDIIRLQTADGEEAEFYEIAGIVLSGKYYVILQPVMLFDGMNEDEALVFEVSRGENGDRFDIVLDDEIVDAVFDEYNELLNEARK